MGAEASTYCAACLHAERFTHIPTIMVLEPNGDLGFEIISSLIYQNQQLAGGNFRIVVGVRRPERIRCKTMDATVVEASMGDDRLTQIFMKEEIDRLLLVAPGTPDRVSLTTKTIKAADEAGVRHITLLSIATSEKSQSRFGLEYGSIENCLKLREDISYTILRIPLLVENHLGDVDSIKNQAEILTPLDPDAKFTSIAAKDVGIAVAKVMLKAHFHENKTYTFAAQPYTMRQFAFLLSRTLGYEINVIKISFEESMAKMIEEGIPHWQAYGLNQLYGQINSGFYMFGIERDFSRIVQSQPIVLEEWIYESRIFFT